MLTDPAASLTDRLLPTFDCLVKVTAPEVCARHAVRD
jgi:hypothetical protein